MIQNKKKNKLFVLRAACSYKLSPCVSVANSSKDLPASQAKNMFTYVQIVLSLGNIVTKFLKQSSFSKYALQKKFSKLNAIFKNEKTLKKFKKILE